LEWRLSWDKYLLNAIEEAENSVIAAAICEFDYQDTKDHHVNPQLVLVSNSLEFWILSKFPSLWQGNDQHQSTSFLFNSNLAAARKIAISVATLQEKFDNIRALMSGRETARQ
jgi:hypothetical protein